MQRYLLVFVLVVFFQQAFTKKPSEWVDNFIGSGGEGFGCGGIPPGAQVPFGILRLSPDTTSYDDIFIPFQHFGGYSYGDVEIRCFSHLHMVGSGVLDYGMIGVTALDHFPTKDDITGYGYRSRFSHETEVAHPGYYSVQLDDWNVKVELTATTHVGGHRYTYAQGSDQIVLMDIGHTLDPQKCGGAEVNIDPSKNEVFGYTINQGSLCSRFGGCKVYYSAIFKNSFANFGTWNAGSIYTQSTHTAGTDLGAVLQFNSSSSIVEYFVGISFVSLDQARLNLQTEVSSSDNFESVRNRTASLWDSYLGKIEIEDPNASDIDLTKFYSFYYHTLLAPTIFSEVGGAYLGFDMKVHQLPPGQNNYYTDMSIWDTHRSEFPWLAFMFPDVMSDIVQSLILMYKQGGDIPRWPLANGFTGCMDGNHADVVIADAYFKGIRNFDVQSAYTGMKAASTEPRQHNGRDDLDWWLKYGFVRYEQSNTACTQTLAYSYDDWAVGNLASALGYNQDAAMFWNRSMNYKNVWNSDYKFFCPKTSTGDWQCPEIWADSWDSKYVEGDAWHYRFWVPQDVPGLIQLFGQETFIDELSKFFEYSRDFNFNVLPNPYYWAGNEPDILSVWLFDFAERPDLTAKYSRWILHHTFTHLPDGLPGNDDYGTMSAWYVWGALGLYPLAGDPQGRYMLGSPMFEKVTIHRPSGDFVILAHNASHENIYVEKASFNGQYLNLLQPFLFHTNFNATNTLELWMTNSPKKFQK